MNRKFKRSAFIWKINLFATFDQFNVSLFNIIIAAFSTAYKIFTCHTIYETCTQSPEQHTKSAKTLSAFDSVFNFIKHCLQNRTHNSLFITQKSNMKYLDFRFKTQPIKMPH